MRISREVRDVAGGILVGALGASAGLLAGILFAPKSGKELRSGFRKRASRAWDRVEGLIGR